MKFKITDNYDHSRVVGSVDIDEETERKLATGEYILTPGWVQGENNRLICLAIIHQSNFDPTPTLTAPDKASPSASGEEQS